MMLRSPSSHRRSATDPSGLGCSGGWQLAPAIGFPKSPTRILVSQLLRGRAVDDFPTAGSCRTAKTAACWPCHRDAVGTLNVRTAKLRTTRAGFAKASFSALRSQCAFASIAVGRLVPAWVHQAANARARTSWVRIVNRECATVASRAVVRKSPTIRIRTTASRRLTRRADAVAHRWANLARAAAGRRRADAVFGGAIVTGCAIFARCAGVLRRIVHSDNRRGAMVNSGCGARWDRCNR